MGKVYKIITERQFSGYCGRFYFSMQAKCEKYWTEQGETKEFGPISVTCVSVGHNFTLNTQD